jgi:hypothetical protein
MVINMCERCNRNSSSEQYKDPNDGLQPYERYRLERLEELAREYGRDRLPLTYDGWVNNRWGND